MGARVYIPALGRFLSVDPAQGGTPNNYVYATDPVNDYDLDGQWSWKAIANVASWASIIPGPIGMIAGGVAAASYAASGDYKSAAIAVAGIALAAVGAGAAVKAVQAIKAAKVGSKLAKAGVKLKDAAHIGAFSKTTGINSKLFGKGGKIAGQSLRKGILNNNPIARVGWGWKGSAKNGSLTFRIAFGSAKWKAHPHIDIRSYKPYSKQWYKR